MTEHHPEHRCCQCNRKFEDHSGAGNPFAPEGRCPSDQAFPAFYYKSTGKNVPLEILDKRLARYWNAKKTTFSVRSAS